MALAPISYALATSWLHIALAEIFLGLGMGAVRQGGMVMKIPGHPLARGFCPLSLTSLSAAGQPQGQSQQSDYTYQL